MRRGSLSNGEPRLFYSGGSHLWEKLSNMDLLKSAGLYAEDHATGKEGFNLAAVILLGRDEVIRDVYPAYQTDALVRKVNVDRYDDRLTVVTNLVESFFRNIGYSEKLGSGARKMFKYGRLYSGADPEFIEDDVFRIIQPLNENYSFDAENEVSGQKTTQNILNAMKDNPNVTISELSEICGITVDGVKWQLRNLTKSGRISRIGGDRGGH